MSGDNHFFMQAGAVMVSWMKSGRELLRARNRKTSATRAVRALAEAIESRRMLTTTTVGGAMWGFQPPNGDWGNGTSVSYSTQGNDGIIKYDNTLFSEGSATVSGLPAHTMARVTASAYWAGSPYMDPGDSDGVTIEAGTVSATLTQTAAGTTGSLTTPWFSHSDSSIGFSVQDEDGEANDGNWVVVWNVDLYTPVVSISGGTSVDEDGDPVTLTVSRDGDASLWGDSLDVPITTGGTATYGSDYTLSSQTVTIPAGLGSAVLTFTPDWDDDVESTETASLTPSPAAPAQAAGGPAVITLQDSTINKVTASPTTITIARPSGTNESTGTITATVKKGGVVQKDVPLDSRSITQGAPGTQGPAVSPDGNKTNSSGTMDFVFAASSSTTPGTYKFEIFEQAGNEKSKVTVTVIVTP